MNLWSAIFYYLIFIAEYNNKNQNFPLFLWRLLTCRVLLMRFSALLSFFSRLSTCLTFLLSFPPIALLLFPITYFLLSLSCLLDLSYNLPTCLNLLTSVIPYWLITCSAFFWVCFNFFCTLILRLTLASSIFLGTLALIAINLSFSCLNYSLEMGRFLKLCLFSSSVNHLGNSS